MQIAAPDITLEMNGRSFCLRPTLGAAIRLAYAYDDLQAIVTALREGSYSVASDIIAEASGRSLAEVRAAMGPPLATHQRAIIDACMAFIHAIADVADDNEPKAKSSGPGITFRALYDQLYALATGWLGWTVQAALDATPAQIILAHRGRIDMLKAIFGTTENAPEAEKTPNFTRDADATATLRMLAGG